MRPIHFLLAIVLSIYSIGVSAAELEFEIGENLFEEPADAGENFALFSYDHPLYDGLWPMTREAFQRLDTPDPKKIFGFTIAFNR